MNDDDILMMLSKKEDPVKLKRPKKIVVPRRQPSVVVPEREVVYITADKTTCAECTCYPAEDPYKKPKRLIFCQKTPNTLYELAAEVVDSLPYPNAFEWSEDDVAAWMENEVGFPEYRGCILDNHIDGMRLLMLEDPSNLPPINIHYFNHIQIITAQVRKLYSTDFVKFMRSIGVPPRRPLVHATWFKSRTGPSWGVRKNWTRCGILRWMKLIMPEPIHRDHWELVWYQRPDYPAVKYGRVPPIERSGSEIPHYKRGSKAKMNIFLVPRKFIINREIPPEEQFIWLEPTPYSPFRLSEESSQKGKEGKKEIKFIIKEDSRLLPPKITTEGLKGRDLILARRKMAKPKFLQVKYA